MLSILAPDHCLAQEQRPTDADSDTPGQPQTRAQYKRIMHLFGRQGTHSNGPAEELSSAFIRNPETSGGSRFVISVTIQDLFKAGLVKAGDEFTYKEHGARSFCPSQPSIIRCVSASVHWPPSQNHQGRTS